MKDTKPWLEKRGDTWEVNPMGLDIKINIGANQKVVIDKLYGPLAASDVRVYLDFQSAEWVVEYMNLTTEKWEEKARWDCQENWPNDNE